MEHAGHRLAGCLGVAVGNADRMVFMQAQQHGGIDIAEMVDHRIMQAAIARARIEAHIAKAETAQHLGCHVTAEANLLVNFPLGAVRMHVSFSLSALGG